MLPEFELEKLNNTWRGGVQKMRKFTQQGFTLIELLIVIVIIGILAGVAIQVIDPVRQQNRAKDGVIQSSMNKVALSTNGFVSAYGRIPNEVEFIAGINSTGTPSCTDPAGDSCYFDVAGTSLSTGDCGADGVSTGNGACHITYCGGDQGIDGGTYDPTACTNAPASTPTFMLAARGAGGENVFVYRSSNSTMYMCQGNFTACDALNN